jgi:hypothetical protein
MAFLQPTAFTGHPKLDHLPRVDHSPEGIRGNFEAVYPRMKAAMKNEKADWAYDLSRVFDGSEGYAFIDFCHLSKNGNEVVAHHIGDVFEKPKSKIEKVEDGQTKVDENRMPPLHLKSERNTEI